MAKKNTASRAAVWVILLLLIVGLAGFGATNFGGSVNSVGAVGDTEISVDRYARELQNELSRLSEQFGTNITFAQAQSFGIPSAVLQRIMSTVALENEADALGISAGDERVRNQLLQITAFQGVDGEFDREGYRFALERAGLTETEFEESLRDDAARGVLRAAVSGAVTVPDIYTDTLLSYSEETRDITWAELTPEDLETPIDDPTEAELRAYWEANEDAFMLPETRDITYAWLTPGMIAGTIEGDDEVLRTLYEERADEFNQPERRLVERLVFPTEAAAQEAMDAIAAGETTFEALVAERDLDLADIDLGDVTEAELGAAGDVVFALDSPGVVGPVETDLGPALMRMNGILEAQTVPFEEAREQLLVEYRTDAARRAIGDKISGIDDLLAGGATIEALGEETEMEVGQIDYTAETRDGIAAYPEFREAAEATEVGDFPEILEASDGAIFALRVNEVAEPRVEPFDQARDAVEAAWRSERTVEALAERAETLADEMPAAGEAAPEPEDEDSPVTFRTDTGVGRSGFVPDVPDGFLDTVFEMETGDTRVIRGDTNAYIVRLDAVTPPDLSDPELAARAEQMQQQLAQRMGQDILDAYASAVQQAAGITINQAALNAVHAQFPQ
ncbi:SurA N-terminal domain-containing protein [Psychromarinibacter sp. C21-152]|uniref:Parvulin-like PPIase n=1 Tax=Psychromarinibacter sediminicola TaxID=3033385 RepID=A0AAE3T8H0_9RHOB|nr:peptidyl-prolyl cis-trans isomerase [Psychromarinibacter sediminicola]MDF0599485.1 SurA N-terminal domain-containing protein [Psychromarinibacter sediminicola]